MTGRPGVSSTSSLCKDPAAGTARFPLRQELRAHLRQIIDRHRLDLTHVTERRGPPFILVCTKTRASHERRLPEYADDVSNMHALAGSTPGERQAGRCAIGLEWLREATAAAEGRLTAGGRERSGGITPEGD